MAEFFVRRPIVAMVIAIIIVIIGLVSLGALPVAQYPEITPPEVQVSATYTGANAEVVEQSVAQALNGSAHAVELTQAFSDIFQWDVDLFVDPPPVAAATG